MTGVRRLAPDWHLRARLKLRHLQLVAALAEHGTLNRAADALHITQPGASRLLAEVEVMAGAALFERHPRGMTANSLGEALARRARAALMELEQAGAELDAMREGTGGAVAVGAVSGPAAGPMVAAVAALRARAPAVRISVDVDTSARLMARLAEGRLDMALARIPDGFDAAGLEYRAVGPEEICLMVRGGHALLARMEPGRPVPLAALAAQPWVLQGPGAPLRQRIEDIFHTAGLPPPRQVIDATSIMFSVAMARHSDAVVALSRPVADLLVETGAMRILPPLAEAPVIAVEPF
ncbi:MAG: LysR family transcriptional regulator, partial [Rhodospirillales bacterium]|nr:LysR family transcriptional regulator [Rhodospirillales bacterium]